MSEECILVCRTLHVLRDFGVIPIHGYASVRAFMRKKVRRPMNTERPSILTIALRGVTQRARRWLLSESFSPSQQRPNRKAFAFVFGLGNIRLKDCSGIGRCGRYGTGLGGIWMSLQAVDQYNAN